MNYGDCFFIVVGPDLMKQSWLLTALSTPQLQKEALPNLKLTLTH